MSILFFDVTLERESAHWVTLTGERERERGGGEREGGREGERERGREGEREEGGGGKTSVLMFVGQITNSSYRRKIRTLPSFFFSQRELIQTMNLPITFTPNNGQCEKQRKKPLLVNPKI